MDKAMDFGIVPFGNVGYHVEAATDAVMMRRLWAELRAGWLALSFERSQSDHTRAAYEAASRLWLEYLASVGMEPWLCSSAHVRGWQARMKAQGNSPATINARMASVSSFYSFVIREVHLINGVEQCAFADATGHARANPFLVGNIRRERVERYGKAKPLAPVDLARLFEHLEQRKETLLGSRNFALVTTYLLTAARNSEIVRMRWGDIRPSRNQTGSYVYAWQGKGGKREDSPLPTRAYEAIKHYLEVAGRWEPEPSEYIWQPIVRHGIANLRHSSGERGYISQKNVVRILQTALRLAGVKDAQQYRVHDLRHTFAHLYNGDLETLRKILHHESLRTTGIYVHSLTDPVDNYSEDIWKQAMGR
jgi:integrase